MSTFIYTVEFDDGLTQEVLVAADTPIEAEEKLQYGDWDGGFETIADRSIVLFSLIEEIETAQMGEMSEVE